MRNLVWKCWDFFLLLINCKEFPIFREGREEIQNQTDGFFVLWHLKIQGKCNFFIFFHLHLGPPLPPDHLEANLEDLQIISGSERSFDYVFAISPLWKLTFQLCPVIWKLFQNWRISTFPSFCDQLRSTYKQNSLLLQRTEWNSKWTIAYNSISQGVRSRLRW